MSLGDIIDATFKLLRANASALAPMLLLAALPFEALTAYAQRNAVSLSQVFSQLGDLQGSTATASAGDFTLVAIGALGLWTVTPIVAGAVCRRVAASYLGGQLAAGAVTRSAGRRAAALLVASILGHLLEGLGFLSCVLPGIAVIALLFLTAPAVVIEGLGPVAGLRRSWRLVAHRFWPVLGTVLLGGFLALVTVEIVSVVPEALAGLAAPHLRAVVDAVVGTVGQAFEWALGSILATVLYLDQRVRQEGLDLEVMAGHLH